MSSATIVYSTDHNGVMPAYVSLKTLFENAAQESSLKVQILINDSVTDQDITLLSSLCVRPNHSITFCQVKDIFSDSYEKGTISKAAYYRLMIPWMFPEEDKVIYIDIDTIVLGDITAILDSAQGDYLFWGVRDIDLALDPYAQKKLKNLDVSISNYINSGVLVINCTELRKQNLKKTFLEYGKRKFFYQDQDIINIVCKGKIGRFPAKYNFMPNQHLKYDKKIIIESGILNEDEYSEAVNSPSIIHYAGTKPWRDYTFKYRDWWKAFESTPIYDESIEISLARIETKKVTVAGVKSAFLILLSKIKRNMLS